VVAYAAGLIAALSISEIRREPGIRTLLQMLATCIVVLAVFDSTRQEYYLIYGITPMCVGFSVFVYKLWAVAWCPEWCWCRSRRIAPLPNLPAGIPLQEWQYDPGSLPTSGRVSQAPRTAINDRDG